MAPPPLAQPPGDAALQGALEVAFRFLAQRDRTVAEVRGRLAAAEVGEEVVEAALGTLRTQGFLDDGRFAQRFAQDRRAVDGWGTRRIEQRLLALGVDRELAVAAASTAHDAELDAALALLRRKLSCTGSDARERDRALGLLVRRGYDFELACDAVRAHMRRRAA